MSRVVNPTSGYNPQQCLENYLARALQRIGANEEMNHLLQASYREIKFELPLVRENGSLAVFHGYRVQHHRSRGPFKGGIRYRPHVDWEQFRALASKTAAGKSASVTELDVKGESISNEELLTLDVDILIPAAVEGVLHENNVDQVKARLIVEGANLPTTCGAAEVFKDRGIPVVPDILANAGGVSVSYFEWAQNLQRYRWERETVDQRLERTLKKAWEKVRKRAAEDNLSYREAAFVIATKRVKRAIELRGF